MARTLLTLGYYTQAQLEIDSAKALVTNDLQGAYLEYQAGSMAQDTGQHTKAIAIFTRVLPVLQHARDIDQTLITQENLAYSLAVVGKFVEARQHLDTAVQLDVNHRQDRERTWTAAKLAYEEHDLPNAIALTDQYFEGRSGAGADADPDDDPEDVDDRIEVAVLRAQIELDLNHLGSAERWAGRAIDLVEHIREQPVLALRPWVLAKRRVPYELRFTALARAGSIDDAVMVFDQLQGRTVQDALARGRQSAALGAFEIADQVTRLDTWGQASKAPLARSTDPKAVLSTMRSIDLLAVIIAGDHVWRLTSHHGPARLAAVGSVKDLEERIRRFSSHPSTETALATELGALLLPDDLFRKTPETLHVIVDDRLAELPVAALRHGTTPLFEVRPSVRELRLPEVGCVPAASALHAGHATVLGDPLGVRTYARAEAEQVAALLGTESKTGAAATTAALFAASSDGVLHVAAETQSGTDGAALLLGDRELPALEIAAHSSAPSLVVLSACSAATVGSEHPEVYGSLGAAFLAAGAQHVVAPLRSISDTGTPDVIMRFYRARGVADPVRALQAAQVELSKTDNADWPLFAVFGPDVCL